MNTLQQHSFTGGVDVLTLAFCVPVDQVPNVVRSIVRAFVSSSGAGESRGIVLPASHA